MKKEYQSPLIKERNNFDMVRTFLALIVFFAHMFTLTQNTNIEWFRYVFNSDFAVKGFFAISGFLVMGSYVSSSSTLNFFGKRLRRIYPAYIVVIFFCLLLGLLTTTLNSVTFFNSSHTLQYLLANLTFLNTFQPTLPGVFQSNPMSMLNGSLWTIKVELCLYACTPFIFYFFEKMGDYSAALVFILMSIFWVYFFKTDLIWGAKISRQFPGQLSYFVMGACLYLNKKLFHQLCVITIISGFLYFVCSNFLFKSFFESAFYSSIVILLSTKAFPSLNFGKYGDLSYGIYLYHFPIIQFLIWGGVFSTHVYTGIALSLILTLLAALCSWHFIEKKFLRRNTPVKSPLHSFSLNLSMGS